MDKKILFNFKDVVLKYNNTEVVHDFNLEINEGEFIVLAGSHRSGKSSIIKALMGDLKPYRGTISFENASIYTEHKNTSNFFSKLKELFGVKNNKQEQLEQKNIKQKIAYLAQITYLPSSAKVGEYIKTVRTAFIAGFNESFEPEEHEKFVNFALEKLNIVDIKNKKLSELDAVEKQKVLIAAAVAKNTPVIVLDDPFKNIDPISQVNIYSLLANLNKETDKTIIISSEVLNQGMIYASSICLLKDGKKLIDAYATESLTPKYLVEAYTDQIMQDSLDGKIKTVDFKILASVEVLKQKLYALNPNANDNLTVNNLNQNNQSLDLQSEDHVNNTNGSISIYDLSVEDKKSILENISNVFSSTIKDNLSTDTSADNEISHSTTFVSEAKSIIEPYYDNVNPIEITAINEPTVENLNEDQEQTQEHLHDSEGYFVKYILDFSLEPEFESTKSFNAWESDFEKSKIYTADFLNNDKRNSLSFDVSTANNKTVDLEYAIDNESALDNKQIQLKTNTKDLTVLENETKKQSYFDTELVTKVLPVKIVDFNDEEEAILSGEYIINFDDPWNCIEDKYPVVFNYDTKADRQLKQKVLKEKLRLKKKTTSGRVASRSYQ